MPTFFEVPLANVAIMIATKRGNVVIQTVDYGFLQFNASQFIADLDVEFLFVCQEQVRFVCYHQGNILHELAKCLGLMVLYGLCHHCQLFNCQLMATTIQIRMDLGYCCGDWYSTAMPIEVQMNVTQLGM